MNKELSPTLVSFDVDGTIFHGPWPITPLTWRQRQTESVRKRIAPRLATWTHGWRKVKPGVRETMDYLHQLGIPMIVLSGRPGHLLPLTVQELRKNDLLYYVEDFFLNKNSRPSHQHKQEYIESLMNSFETLHLAHFEDDPVAAQAIANINPERITVFLMATPLNGLGLLTRQGIKLPKNVIRIPGMKNLGHLKEVFENQKDKSQRSGRTSL